MRRPWAVNRRVVALAEQRFARGDAPSLYRFVDEGRRIELHPRGQAYLHHNLAIVTGFCRWNRVTALPRNNPTVPTVAGKLAEPGPRERGVAVLAHGAGGAGFLALRLVGRSARRRATSVVA